MRHISRRKKDSSDDVLRQEMRRIVDTSAEPGRIVLISGKVYTSYDSTFSNLGDCDFSKDLHGFRYRKSYEIVLIHNALAKPALIQCANFAFNFETVLTQLEDAWEEQMGERKLKRKKKKEKIPGNNDKARKAPNKVVTSFTEKKKGNKKINEKNNKLELHGTPSIGNEEICKITKSLVTTLRDQKTSLEYACNLIVDKFHKTTIEEFVENFFIEILETDASTRSSGGNLLVLLLNKGLLDQSCVVKCGFNNLLMNASDMISVLPDIWDFIADIISPLLCTGALPLETLKECKSLLQEDLIGKYLSSSLNQMAQTAGHFKVKKLWRDSNLEWTDFLDNVEAVKGFVQANKLEWLGFGQSMANAYTSSIQDLVGIQFEDFGSTSSLVSPEHEEDDSSTSDSDYDYLTEEVDNLIVF